MRPGRPNRQAKLYPDQSVAMNSSTTEGPLNDTHTAASTALITSNSQETKPEKMNRCQRVSLTKSLIKSGHLVFSYTVLESIRLVKAVNIILRKLIDFLCEI